MDYYVIMVLKKYPSIKIMLSLRSLFFVILLNKLFIYYIVKSKIVLKKYN